MEMEECKQKVKCDFYGCGNLAKYSFKTKRMFRSELHFCDSCVNGIYEEVRKTIIPKGIESPFKQGKTKRG